MSEPLIGIRHQLLFILLINQLIFQGMKCIDLISAFLLNNFIRHESITKSYQCGQREKSENLIIKGTFSE